MTTTEKLTDPRKRVISGELLETAQREMLCVCLEDYVRRGMFDPHCRCDDRDDLAKEAYESGRHEMYPAVALLEEALHLRMNGEYAPGGKENWHDWDRKAETFLRGLASEKEAQ